MAKPLTPITIANLRPRAKPYEISDVGCTNLRVVVFPSRRKSYIVRYRFRGLQRKLTLGPFGPYLQFLLLTATRRNEAAGLHGGELSDDGKAWVIPGARYKTKLDTLIPLSGAAQKIIAAQPQLGSFVFSATGEYPIGDFAHRKTAFDRVCGVADWHIHDLRRTSRTLLSRAGIAADIAERCLGHALTGMRAVYDRHEFEIEKRHAFEALAALIERIVHPPEAAVADIAAERGKRRR